MRYILFSCALFFLHKQCVGQTNTNNSKVYILGLIHKGTKHFGYQELVKKFESINPDIILWEQSIPFKKVFGLGTANFLKIWRPGIEQLALQKFKSQKEHFSVLPFDTIIRNRKAYVRTQQQNRDKFFNLLCSTKKSEPDSINLAEYSKELNSYHNEINNKSLEEINDSTIVSRTRNLYKLEDTKIASILFKYSNDSLLNRWYMNDRNFWIARNTYMAQQIERIALANPGKTIIVLTGLNHKYFLVDKLKNKRDIQLMEIN